MAEHVKTLNGLQSKRGINFSSLQEESLLENIAVALGIQDFNIVEIIALGLYSKASIGAGVSSSTVKADKASATWVKLQDNFRTLEDIGLSGTSLTELRKVLSLLVAYRTDRVNDKIDEIRDVHPSFSAALSRVYPGAVAVPVHRREDRMCDFLLDFSGDLVPVEIKKGKFDRKAVTQLRGYMEAYEARRGIAVGDVLAAPLRPGMEFISLAELSPVSEASRTY